MARIGAHFHVDNPLDDAVARGADAAQFFLGDPQGWKGPVIPGGDPSAIRDAFAAAGVDPADGLENWRKAVERIERPLPMLIENTAGGDGAMARSLDAIGRLWDAVTGAAGDDANLGFCLDTCHANSAGIDLADAVDRVKAITGRIDLVHCNNSRDEFGSGRDRHANIAAGTIDPALLLAVVRAAGAPAICETPDEDGGLAADVSWLKQHLPASRCAG